MKISSNTFIYSLFLHIYSHCFLLNDFIFFCGTHVIPYRTNTLECCLVSKTSLTQYVDDNGTHLHLTSSHLNEYDQQNAEKVFETDFKWRLFSVQVTVSPHLDRTEQN